ncbi:hypothetical protein [Dyadobacter sp. NIV53]|uniref:hypothetical protein n=1 Tax=Dyadobacter sp. NIV53 TaxID=2861765 RepID=UPI001C880112|nr:hypothetical protein [Dyadobacter sp. NIV53]
MLHEKIFILETRRTVKLIVSRERTQDHSDTKTKIEVLIREANEQDFRLPIGISHPQYWKLKRLDSEQAAMLQLSYSGITERQIRSAIKEMDSLAERIPVMA